MALLLVPVGTPLIVIEREVEFAATAVTILATNPAGRFVNHEETSVPAGILVVLAPARVMVIAFGVRSTDVHPVTVPLATAADAGPA